MWCTETKKIKISRDVIFDESAILHDLPFGDSSKTQKQSSIMQVKLQIDSRTTPRSTSYSNSDFKSDESPLLAPAP